MRHIGDWLFTTFLTQQRSIFDSSSDFPIYRRDMATPQYFMQELFLCKKWVIAPLTRLWHMAIASLWLMLNVVICFISLGSESESYGWTDFPPKNLACWIVPFQVGPQKKTRNRKVSGAHSLCTRSLFRSIFFSLPLCLLKNVKRMNPWTFTQVAANCHFPCF